MLDFQGTNNTQAPAPFEQAEIWVGDPIWDMCGSDTITCNMAWALIVQNSEAIFIDGAGLYSWFNKGYTEDCVDTKDCQQRLVNIYNTGHLFLNHLVTIGAVETLTPAISNRYNEIKYTADHLQATGYPWWTTISTYLDSSGSINASVSPFPVKQGWVSFGDSYAAGIGAGTPLDQVDKCKRGTGSHIAILNQVMKFVHDVQLTWQPLACSGETAQQFLDGGDASAQLSSWTPSSSDIGTSSFTGNDLGFADIVSHCIMGYPLGSRSQCQPDIKAAKAKLDNNKVQELVHDVMDKILAAAGKVSGKDRFIIYWTGYPKFFTVVDNVCDNCYFREGIWAGEYLTRDLRNTLNELSVEVNDQIGYAIRRYNAGRPYPKVVFVSPEAIGTIYEGKRFCEAKIQETQKTEALQNNVAFFYDDGWDDIPSASEGFALPPTFDQKAPGSWSKDYNSATCADDDPIALENALCDMAKAIANGTMSAADFMSIAGDPVSGITQNPDGSVTIQDWYVRFTKMFHPKTRANWRIAQALHESLRLN